MIEVRGHQRVTSANPEEAYEALSKYGRDLVDIYPESEDVPF